MKDVKVGLCCCFENHNYGSMLQSLANLRAIESLGHECEVIRYIKQYSFVQKVRQAPRLLNAGNIAKIAQQLELRRQSLVFPEIAAERATRDSAFDRFSDSFFSTSIRQCIGYDSLTEASESYGAVVVGSDQLWLPIGLPTNFYNLQFVKPGVRRVSYATSFGVTNIPWYQRRRTADFLRKIDYLSVREDAGAIICRKIAGVDAKVVVDPTLLLTREDWLDLISSKQRESEPYIFCYFLGHNRLCREEAKRISKEMNLPIVVLRHLDEIVPADEQFGDYSPYDIDPSGFVNLIRNAEVVLTDSFHGTVFSVLHHKRFATYYRFETTDGQSRNSRIDSLFAHLGLKERLVTQSGQSIRVLCRVIDYSAVDQSLSDWRKDSWSFLTKALS